MEKLKNNDFVESAKIALSEKAESLHSQLKRLNIPAKTLNHGDLIKLFYDFYNEESETLINNVS